MKKTLMIIVLIFTFVNIYSQSEKFSILNKLTNDITNETSGVIFKITDCDSLCVSRINLPSFYDQTLTIQSVDIVLKRYSDIILLNAWQVDFGTYISKKVKVNNYNIKFRFSENNTYLIIMIK